MSSYKVLASAGRLLRSTLWEAFQTDQVLSAIVGNEEGIAFTTPTEIARDSSNRLSLWLYRVTEDTAVRNSPSRLRNSGQLRGRPPLALNLHYLITPYTASAESDLLLLGRTIEALLDKPVLLLHETAGDVAEELRISFAQLTLEELTRIWEALREPYRISVTIQVSAVHIT